MCTCRCILFWSFSKTKATSQAYVTLVDCAYPVWGSLDILLPKTLRLFGISNLDYECFWWMPFQKRIVLTRLLVRYIFCYWNLQFLSLIIIIKVKVIHPQPMLVILFKPFGFLAANLGKKLFGFQIFWFWAVISYTLRKASTIKYIFTTDYITWLLFSIIVRS